jgi:hypothetical protein
VVPHGRTQATKVLWGTANPVDAPRGHHFNVAARDGFEQHIELRAAISAP